VALVNSIQVLLGSLAAVAFGYVAASSRLGFSVAWVMIGALTIGLLPLLVLVVPNRAGMPVPPEDPVVRSS